MNLEITQEEKGEIIDNNKELKNIETKSYDQQKDPLIFNNDKKKNKKKKNKNKKKKNKNKNKIKLKKQGKLDIEIGIGIDNRKSNLEAFANVRIGRNNSFILFDADNVPHRHVGFTKFVKTGYRMNFNIALCFKSVFKLHNQTLNIWSHFLGFLVFIGITIYIYSSKTPVTTSKTNEIIMGVYIAGTLLCFSTSTIYHIFECYSVKAYKALFIVDLTGVIVMIETSYLPIIFYNFPKHNFFRNFYLIIMGLLGIFLIYLIWFQRSFMDSHPYFRTFAFFGVCGFTVVPLIHMLIIIPENHAINILWRVLVVLLIYGLGCVLIAFQIPERYSPKSRFDNFGSSHNIWHFCVVCAALFHFFNCLYFMEDPVI
ncbi:adiponectin receptor protein [Anaeramoeba ignava]|uniref:Adiponectin receptor protein n=1 Tax=Anaeramoeba ignava TaxID=1746090 RepID=A0A9Q0RF37_ANAIG|nr:adiponectin receptor protein [Anaeramoeba ignava]